MARTKRGVTSRAKHKKVLKAVKGQYGRRKNTIRVARQAMEKAMQYAYRDRKVKKREFKTLWIQRINAGVRSEGITYSQFINGLNKSKIKLDSDIHNKKNTMEKEIEIEISKAQKEILELKKNSVDTINAISQEITSNIIEKMSGDKLNESSIKAAVEDVAKQNKGEYL